VNDDDTKRHADALIVRMSVLSIAGVAVSRVSDLAVRLGSLSLAKLALETQKRITAETKRAAGAHSELLAQSRRRHFRIVN
jgi:hypothetical protein